MRIYTRKEKIIAFPGTVPGRTLKGIKERTDKRRGESMKRIILFYMFFCVLFVVNGFAEESEMPVIASPEIVQVVGDNDAVIGPTRYPDFYDYSCDNPTCAEYLKAEYDGEVNDDNEAVNGLTLAPLWVKSKYSRSGSSCPAPLPGPVDFTFVPGLSTTIDVPAAYRKTANIMVTWTVRVEGEKVDNYDPWPCLCHPWHGTSSQRFPGGVIKTALYIKTPTQGDWRKVGDEALMTIPDGGASTINRVRDPTHTGSYLVTKEDFGGELPASLSLGIKWYNDTCLEITSPKSMRNLIVTIIPVEK